MERGQSKHGPNSLSNYREAHTTVMRQFLDRLFVEKDDVRFGVEHEGVIPVGGLIWCAGGLYVDVTKELSILKSAGANPLVRCTAYRYHAQAIGKGPIIRYDSFHPHRQMHHVHIYPLFSGNPTEQIEEVRTEYEIPTLGEFLLKIEGWYYQQSR